MLLSMTGFGKAKKTFSHKTITVQIKSLNGKTSDVRLKLPNNYREKELLIRKKIMNGAVRGKMEASIEFSSDEGEGDFGLNKSLFKKYFREITALQGELGLDSGDLVQGILRIPNVIQAEEGDLTDEEWQTLQEAVEEALEKLNTFRATEGVAMEADMKKNVISIASLLDKVDEYEVERIEKLKIRLRKNLEEYLGKGNVDENRFEQEVLFYLERMDINEEKVRLGQHCKYFLEQLASDEKAKGRKLSFISQEMGREINTLGAKAQHSELQKLVVGMKDELERIKEQVLNVV